MWFCLWVVVIRLHGIRSRLVVVCGWLGCCFGSLLFGVASVVVCGYLCCRLLIVLGNVLPVR